MIVTLGPPKDRFGKGHQIEKLHSISFSQEEKKILTLLGNIYNLAWLPIWKDETNFPNLVLMKGLHTNVHSGLPQTFLLESTMMVLRFQKSLLQTAFVSVLNLTVGRCVCVCVCVNHKVVYIHARTQCTNIHMYYTNHMYTCTSHVARK